jgi:hypothetical protein
MVVLAHLQISDGARTFYGTLEAFRGAGSAMLFCLNLAYVENEPCEGWVA